MMVAVNAPKRLAALTLRASAFGGKRVVASHYPAAEIMTLSCEPRPFSCSPNGVEKARLSSFSQQVA
jgi:hypothetical protein